MFYETIVKIVKLGFTPFSIFSPIPFFCIILFLVANNYSAIDVYQIQILILGIIISLLSSSASNFWNHTNDITEDIKNNRKTILTEKVIKKNDAILISLILYFASFFLVIYVSVILHRPIYLFFSIWLIITWWYSDDIYLKKITGFRLKTHYLGEIFTYGIAYPSYTISIWLIFSNSLSKGIILALFFLCFGMAGVLLKDLKDIRGDREAGLKTLGVVFSPSRLIQMACFFLIIYFLLILLATNQKIFDILSFTVIFPFVYLIKNTFLHFHRKNWSLEINDSKNIKAMILSTYSSLFLFGFSNFIR